MELPLRVLVADCDEDFVKSLGERFTEENGASIIARTESAAELIELSERLQPDLLLTELVLRGMDGVSALRRMRREGQGCQTIVVTDFVNAACTRDCAALGVSAIVIKPCDTQALLERALGLGGRTAALSEQDEEDLLAGELLCALGVPLHIRGYAYLKEAIRRVAHEPSCISNITKVLYPEIAESFGSTGAKVERSMRHAIELAWARGDAAARADFLRDCPALKADRPTNTEFISLLARRLRAKLRKNENYPM